MLTFSRTLFFFLHGLFFFFFFFFFTNKTHTADLSNAGIVWIDNQSWDEHLTNSIYKKLNQDLIPGSIVIEYAMSKFGVFFKSFVLTLPINILILVKSYIYLSLHGILVFYLFFYKHLGDFHASATLFLGDLLGTFFQ